MFKQFNSEQVNTYEFRSHKTYTLNQSNVNRKQFLSESLDDTATNYYNFARINFYMSGSDLASEGDKFNTYPTIGNRFNNDKMFFNKFYNSGSLLFVSQSQFGDGIKKGSFSLTDNSTAATIKIVDDSKYIESIFSENSVKDNKQIINYLADNKIDSVIDVINYYEKNEPGIIPLLVWLFNRDLQAVNMILNRSGSVRKLGIWDSQLDSYNKIAGRFTKKKVESALSLLDESDKKFKGFLKGNPWDSLRELVFKFI